MAASVAPAASVRAPHLSSVSTSPTTATGPRPTARVLSMGLETVACALALRAALRAAGILDGDVGAALGLPESRVAAMLAGARPLYLAHIRRLARRLPASAAACRLALASIVSIVD